MELEQIFGSLRWGRLNFLSDTGDSQSSAAVTCLRQFLPCLLRMSLCPEAIPSSASEEMDADRKILHRCLLEMEEANFVITLMSVNFSEADEDARREMLVRKKVRNVEGKTLSVHENSGVRFEKGDATSKVRFVLNEMITCKEIMEDVKSASFPEEPSLRRFEPFDCVSLLDQASDVLCVVLAELPDLLTVEQCVEPLLSYQHGPAILQKLVANFPDQWERVISSIVSNARFSDESRWTVDQRTRALQLLCDLLPSHTCLVIDMLITQRKLASSIIQLACRHLQNRPFVALISSLILRKPGPSTIDDNSTWFLHFLVQTQKKFGKSPTILSMKRKLWNYIHELISCQNDSSILPVERVAETMELLRLLAALKSTAHLRMSGEESAQILRLICSRLPVIKESMELATVGIAAVLACPALIHAAGGGACPDAESQLIGWVGWLLSVEPQFETVNGSGRGSEYGEFLLLSAIQFHSSQFALIAQLLTSVLGIKVNVQAKLMTRLKTIFTLDMFPENRVAERAAAMPVTVGLNANTSGYLPVHCVLQMLRGRTFAKHKVSIKEWIIAQVKECRSPVHSSMPELLEAYAKSCILPLTRTEKSDLLQTQQLHSVANPPLDENSLLDILKGNPLETDSILPRILVFYYVLAYGDTWLGEARKIAVAGRTALQYTEKLWNTIPIKFFVDYVEHNEKDFAALHSPIIKLISTLCPYFLPSDSKGSHSESAVRPSSSQSSSLEDRQLAQALVNAPVTPGLSLRMLKRLQSADDCDKVALLDTFVDKGIVTLLQSDVPHSFTQEYVRCWSQYEAVLPRRVYEKTISVLVANADDQKTNWRLQRVSHQQLVDDPLILFRCSDKVFRRRALLEILLRMLGFYMLAFRVHQTQRLVAAAATPAANTPVDQQQRAANDIETERNELAGALINAQESAIVQILLEACLPNDKDLDEAGQLNVLREIRCLICAHLHQMFIRDPVLSKLVHFQTYSNSLIPVTVKGIPSMHICLDFIPELLNQPDMNKRVFAVGLLSYLCEQFTIPKALSFARFAVDCLSTLLSALPSELSVALFLQVVPALGRINRVFPPLTSDICSLLTQVGQVCSARLATQSLGRYSNSTCHHSVTISNYSKFSKISKTQKASADLLLAERSKEAKLLRLLWRTYRSKMGDSVLLNAFS